MSCAEWEARVAAYCSGPVDAAEAAAVDAHLSTCAVCRRAAEEMRACLGVLRDSDYAAVRARVLGSVAPSRRRLWKWAATAALAAAAALLFAFEVPSRPEQLPVRAIALPPAPPISLPVAAPVPLRVHRVAMHRAVRPNLIPVAQSAPEVKPLVVKLVTDDPNVVIYWITSKSGE